jgi:hypothetical protein
MYRSTTIIHILLFTLQVALIPVLMLGCANAGGKKSTPALSAPGVWYEGQQKKSAWRAWDELAVFLPRDTAGCPSEAQLTSRMGPNARVTDRLTGLLVFTIPSSMASSAEELDRCIGDLKAQACVSAVGLVYYADTRRNPATRLIHTDELVVRLDPFLGPSKIARLEADLNLTLKMKPRYAPNTMIYAVPTPRLVLETANRLRMMDGVLDAYPNWLRRRVTK